MDCLLSVKVVSERLGVKPATVRKYIKDKRMRCSHKVGNLLRITESDYNDFVESNKRD